MVSILISNGISTIRNSDETIEQHIARHQKAVSEDAN